MQRSRGGCEEGQDSMKAKRGQETTASVCGAAPLRGFADSERCIINCSADATVGFDPTALHPASSTLHRKENIQIVRIRPHTNRHRHRHRQIALCVCVCVRARTIRVSTRPWM